MYFIIFAPQTVDMKSYTYSLWSVIIQHEMTGGTLEKKKMWTEIVDQAMLTHEQRRWKAELVDKGVHRFLRVHESLRPSVLYSINWNVENLE